MVQPIRPLEEVGTKRTGGSKGGRRQRYVLHEWQRNILLAEYSSDTETITRLTSILGVPRWKVLTWGQQLGLTREHDPRWTTEEIAYLERNLSHKSLADIARHLGRSSAAVRRKADRMHLNKCFQEGYTLAAVATGLGVDCRKVRQWAQAGLLHGTRRGTERPRDVWYFSEDALRNFIRKHPDQLDLRRVDKYWFLDIVFKTGLGNLSGHEEQTG